VFVPSTFVARARASFGDTLERLGVGEDAVRADAGDPCAEDLGRRAAILVGAQRVWDHHLGPLLGASEVAELLGVGTRQAVHDRARRGGLLALHQGSRQVRFPAFQLIDRPGSATKMVIPGLRGILSAFADAGVDPWTVASWFCTPAELLADVTPARWLAEGSDPEGALDAARRSAARLGQ
jgi:hypothetical protein